MPTPEPVPDPDAPRAAGLQVLRRFHYPLPARPGYAALYAEVVAEPSADGRHWLRWDGVAPLARIPPAYASPPLSQSDACPRRDGP